MALAAMLHSSRVAMVNNFVAFIFLLFLIRFLLQKYNIFFTRARKTRICCSSAIVWNKNGTKKKHPPRQKFAAAIAANSYGNCIIQNNQWPLHENY
jgi:hypothetical protein